MLNALRQSEENHAFHWVNWHQAFKVLNALRQSEENHLADSSRPEQGSTGAQRLTAIRGKSPSDHQVNSLAFQVCSTPYGNQRKITPGQSDGIPSWTTCSTPYGNQRKITAHPRILTLQGSDGAFASMYPYSIHQLPARRQVS